MKLQFTNAKQIKWVFDSLHLYRTFKYLTFKRDMEFPQFLALDAATQDARCQCHNKTIFRFREWLDELDQGNCVTVKNKEAAFMLQCLTYRPYLFTQAKDVIPKQLHLLECVTSVNPPR